MTLYIIGMNGDAPKLNGCCYCKHFPGLYALCLHGKYRGHKMTYHAIPVWTCEAFEQIGAE